MSLPRVRMCLGGDRRDGPPMTESELRGPIFMVHLDRDEPWISAIIEADEFSRSELQRAKSGYFKRASAGIFAAKGTPLTWDELSWLEDGQKMLAMFFAGDLSRRNRQRIPERIEQVRDVIEAGDDAFGDGLEYVAELQAELRDLD